MLLPSEIHALNATFPNGIVALDFETTGLSPMNDRAIEIAAVKYIDGSLQKMVSFINPERAISAAAFAVHGITEEMVERAPTMTELLPMILSFIGHAPIIAHNAKFDLGFLVAALHHNNRELPPNKVYCSLTLSRKALKGLKSYKLKSLCEELGIDLENQHRALDDAFATLRMTGKILSDLSLHSLERSHEILDKSFLCNLQSYSKVTSLLTPPHLQILLEACEKQRTIEINYKGGSKPGFRTIRAISLLPMPDGNVLYAFCVASNLYKSFLLSKIEEAKELS